MKNLKVGDIKKFNNGDEEFVAAVVEANDIGVTLINMDGYKKTFDFYRCTRMSYSATRLAPEIREQFDKIVDSYKVYSRLLSDIEKMKALSEKKLDAVKKDIEKLQSIQGKFSYDKTGEVFLKYLSKVKPTVVKKLESDYRMDCSKTPVGVWLQFTRYEEIEKWANPHSYSFLYRDYETLRIGEKNNSYKELCNKHSKGDAKFELSKLKGDFRVTSELTVGDKDSLYYRNVISVLFPMDCLTEDYMKKLIKSVK